MVAEMLWFIRKVTKPKSPCLRVPDGLAETYLGRIIPRGKAVGNRVPVRHSGIWLWLRATD